jgi:hypothetical protein
MPYYSFKEIWTPLRLLRIRFFLEVSEKKFWIKVGSQSRKRLFKKAEYV